MASEWFSYQKKIKEVELEVDSVKFESEWKDEGGESEGESVSLFF